MVSTSRMISRCALLAALNCVCGWIALPLGDIVITMQTFSVMLTLGLAGGKWGTVTIGVYLLLGAVGMPVFSGFRGGIGMLFGTTGGYLLGFLATGVIYWGITALFGEKARIAAGVMGLIACYAVGTVWYLIFYSGGRGLTAVFLKCVVPYVIPDAVKLASAFALTDRLKRFSLN